MRMQNTDMEFVTFDAQDVIATSGPLTSTPLAARIYTIAEYNKANDPDLLNGSGNTQGIRTEEEDKQYAGTQSSKAGKWLTYSADSLTSDGDFMDSNKPTSGYVFAEDVNGIVNWLKAYGYIQ